MLSGRPRASTPCTRVIRQSTPEHDGCDNGPSFSSKKYSGLELPEWKGWAKSCCCLVGKRDEKRWTETFFGTREKPGLRAWGATNRHTHVNSTEVHENMCERPSKKQPAAGTFRLLHSRFVSFIIIGTIRDSPTPSLTQISGKLP